MPAFKDLTGKQFGRLRVLHRAENRNGRVMWNCTCECGNTVPVSAIGMTTGKTKSCGCLVAITAAKNFTNHGETSGKVISAEYRTYRSIISRCYNAKTIQYADYGGRGISMCERWLQSFSNFLNDMGRKPSETHSIERKDNTGNYSPDNCYWADRITQANNKRNNVRLEINGVTKTICDWARVSGVKESTIRRRIGLGWPVSDAVHKPTRHLNRPKS